MNASPTRVRTFIEEMRAGLDQRVSEGHPEHFTMQVPGDFSNDDVEALASELHQDGKICMFGICCGHSRFSMPFVAVRLFSLTGFVQFKQEEARTGIWSVIAAGLGLTAGGIWLAMINLFAMLFFGALLIVMWVAAIASVKRNADRVRHVVIPIEPVRDFVPYHDWH